MIYLTAVLCGLLMNAMPCVAPVLALKIRTFGQPGKRWPYVAGVLCSFLTLGLLSLVLGTGISHMSNQWFRATLCLVCGLMGTHLLGWWQMPSFGVRGEWGPFGMGCLTVALGTSCSVPFLAPVMVYCANSPWYETIGLFMALGVGFSSPFIVPIPIPEWISRGLGDSFERCCGVVMLVVAYWLSHTLMSDFTLFCLSCVLFFVGYVRIRNKGMLGSLNSSIVCYSLLLVCWLGHLFYLCNNPKHSYAEEWPSSGPRVIFVTADWCVNCHVAHKTLTQSRVLQLLEHNGIQEVTVLDYTDTRQNLTRFLVQNCGSPSVPMLLVENSTGRVTVLSGLWTVDSVIRSLNNKP